MDHIKQIEHGDTLRSPYLWGLKMKIKKLSSKDIKILTEKKRCISSFKIICCSDIPL